MARDKKKWTMARLRKSTLQKLKKRKVHPNEAYDDAILRLMEKEDEMDKILTLKTDNTKFVNAVADVLEEKLKDK